MQRRAAVHHFTVRGVHAQDVVIDHPEMAALVVERRACIDVVRGIDVQPPLEHVRRWIGGVDVRDQRLGDGAGGEVLQVLVQRGRFV